MGRKTRTQDAACWTNARSEHAARDGHDGTDGTGDRGPGPGPGPSEIFLWKNWAFLLTFFVMNKP